MTRRLIALDLHDLRDEKEKSLREVAKAVSAELNRRDSELFVSGEYPEMDPKELETLKSSLTDAIVAYRRRVNCSLGLAKLVVESYKYNRPGHW